jgi:hypothetical protein
MAGGCLSRGRHKCGPYGAAMNGGGSFRKEAEEHHQMDMQMHFFNRILAPPRHSWQHCTGHIYGAHPSFMAPTRHLWRPPVIYHIIGPLRCYVCIWLINRGREYNKGIVSLY